MANSKQKTKIKKQSNLKHWKHALAISAGIFAICASSGLVFGITAATASSVKYVTLNPYDDSIASVSYEESTPTKTIWSASETEPTSMTSIATSSQITEQKDFETLYQYAEMINDGSTHQILDQSFNEGTYQGLVNWVHQLTNGWLPGEEMQVTMKDLATENIKDSSVNSALAGKPTADTPSGFINTYKAAIQSGVKSLVLPGFNHVTPLTTFPAEDESTFKKSGYILIDGTFSTSNSTWNEYVASVMFRSDEAAFLAALAACQYLQDNYDNVYSKVNNGQLAMGAFGGTAIPTVTIYLGGFEWGIWVYNNFVLPKLAADEGWTEEEITKRTIKFIDLGRESSYFSGTFTVGDARLIVQQLLAYGADIILPVAGPQTADACSEIVNQKSPAKVIGVDTDQENGDLGRYESQSSLNEGSKVICFSAQKDIAYITSMILEASAEGKRGYYVDSNTNTVQPLEWNGEDTLTTKVDAQDSAICSYGYTTVGNVNNNAVKVSEAGKEYIVELCKILNSDGSITDYDSALAYLKTQNFECNGHNVTFFQLLDQNMKFIY